MLGYNAARWHAVLNDLPAALLLVAVLFDLAAAATKRESLMWAGIWTLWAGVIGGWAAVVAGKLPSGTLEHGEAVHQNIDKHEDKGPPTMGLVPLRPLLPRRPHLLVAPHDPPVCRTDPRSAPRRDQRTAGTRHPVRGLVAARRHDRGALRQSA